MNILDKIVARKREEIAFSKSKISVEELKNSEYFGRETFSLKESVKSRNGIIAEFKRQSPSKGIINDKVAPLEVVTKYEEFGASGISILTDKDFFGGSFEDILSVRNSVNIPILRKDFMVDEYQFYEAKSIGADVILLIAACLSPSQVQEFTALAHELNLEVLLEKISEFLFLPNWCRIKSSAQKLTFRVQPNQFPKIKRSYMAQMFLNYLNPQPHILQ